MLALAIIMAWLASAVLVYAWRKMRSTDLVVTAGWCLAGAVAVGAGAWASQLAMALSLGWRWPLQITGGALLLTLLVSVLSAGAAFAGAAWLPDRVTRLAMGVVGFMGAIAFPFIYLCNGLTGGWYWSWPMLLIAGVFGLAGIAASLVSLLYKVFERFTHRHDRTQVAVGLAAVGWMLGLVIEVNAVCVPVAAPAPNGPAGAFALTSLVVVGILVLLLGLVSAAVDARGRFRTRTLATSLQEANSRLRQIAFCDPLTGLPNRLMFEDCLKQALARVGRTPGVLAVLFIDLDGFKPINDSFGHATGDGVLREVGQRLQNIAGDNDLVARIGGDEFLLLIEGKATTEAVAHAAHRVLNTLNQPYELPQAADVNLSCSIGIAMFPEHGPIAKLVSNADAAMYAAKRAGGSTYAFFEARMDIDVRDQVELQHDLRQALERNELELYYQPKVDGHSGQITGAEALVRWHHPLRGMISPTIFIPVAERFGLIGQLGNWVIEDACRQVKAWRDGGLRMRVAVNLSMHQLRQEDLVQRVRMAIEAYEIDPKLLTFEITESVAMEDTSATMRSFAQLAHVGVSMSIDDFGTGYSSLAYLRKLPAKQLKIDRSFVADLGHSPDALAVVDAVVSLAHALGLKVVAEGVETERQRDILLALHCDELQGYLYAKPMSARSLTLWAMDDEGPRALSFRHSLFGENPSDAFT